LIDPEDDFPSEQAIFFMKQSTR